MGWVKLEPHVKNSPLSTAWRAVTLTSWMFEFGWGKHFGLASHINIVHCNHNSSDLITMKNCNNN